MNKAYILLALGVVLGTTSLIVIESKKVSIILKADKKERNSNLKHIYSNMGNETKSDKGMLMIEKKEVTTDPSWGKVKVISGDILLDTNQNYTKRTVLVTEGENKILLIERFNKDLELMRYESYPVDTISIEILPSCWPAPPLIGAGENKEKSLLFEYTTGVRGNLGGYKNLPHAKILNSIEQKYMDNIVGVSSYGDPNLGAKVTLKSPNTPRDIFSTINKIESLGKENIIVNLTKG
jgi:hypothetical protein